MAGFVALYDACAGLLNGELAIRWLSAVIR